MKQLLYGRISAPLMVLSRSALCATVVLLAACAGVPLPASVKGGECRIFDRPKYEVKGSKQYDQNWIDGNIEAGVGGCNWTRPEPRPPNIDAGAKVVEAAPVAPRRSGIWQRTKARVKRLVPHHSAPAVATPVAAAPDPLSAPISGTPTTFDPPVAPAPEPKPPRKPIDELLKPSR